MTTEATPLARLAALLVDLADALNHIDAQRRIESPRPPTSGCTVCHAPLAPTLPGRGPRTYCSPACRSRAYRRRTKTEHYTPGTAHASTIKEPQ